MKTEAALLVQTGTPLVVAEIEIPVLKPGQVLVEITYSGACGTQVMEWRGDKGEDKWVPHCLGHEGTGVVLETGSAVTKVKADDKVVLSWIKGSGIEAGGAVYEWDGKKVNAGGVTTFQRHAVVSENRLTLLPGEIRKIVPQGVDLAVESSGVPAVMEQAVNATRQQGGRAVVIGNARHGAMLSLNPGIFNQGKSLLGTWGGDSVPDRDYGRFGRLLGSGRFPVRDLLSKPYSLEQADQALQDLAAGKVGRPLIDMSLRRSG